MLNYLQQYISEIFAGFAVILAAVSNWRSVRTEGELKTSQKAARGMDMLIEIQRKNSCVGKLALVTAQKILLLQKYPNLIQKADSEIERLRNNLNVFQEFKQNEQEQAQLAESVWGGSDVYLHTQALTKIRQLRISMEADVEKETSIYNQLLEDARGN